MWKWCLYKLRWKEVECIKCIENGRSLTLGGPAAQLYLALNYIDIFNFPFIWTDLHSIQTFINFLFSLFLFFIHHQKVRRQTFATSFSVDPAKKWFFGFWIHIYSSDTTSLFSALNYIFKLNYYYLFMHLLLHSLSCRFTARRFSIYGMHTCGYYYTLFNLCVPIWAVLLGQ